MSESKDLYKKVKKEISKDNNLKTLKNQIKKLKNKINLEKSVFNNVCDEIGKIHKKARLKDMIYGLSIEDLHDLNDFDKKSKLHEFVGTFKMQKIKEEIYEKSDLINSELKILKIDIIQNKIKQLEKIYFK